MHNITFKLSDLHQHGSAFFEYLALRKSFFVDCLQWDVPHDASLEMDQYDNPTAHYSLVIDNGRVIGGARATPTNAVWGSSSYMLRDAQRGLIGGIPSDLLGTDIVSEKVWECTRLVIDDAVNTANDRRQCLSLIVSGLADQASGYGAEQLMSLSPVALMRSLRQLGFGAEKLSAPYIGKEDGRRYAILGMSLNTIMEAEFAQAA